MGQDWIAGKTPLTRRNGGPYFTFRYPLAKLAIVLTTINWPISTVKHVSRALSLSPIFIFFSNHTRSSTKRYPSNEVSLVPKHSYST
jgi:hypothetical protein